MKKLARLLQYCTLRKRESKALTIGLLLQWEEMEYEDMSSDRKNLRNDIRNIGDDLWVGIQDCKRAHNIEFI